MITDVTVFPRISSRAYRIGIKHSNEHTYTLVSGLKCNSIELVNSLTLMKLCFIFNTDIYFYRTGTQYQIKNN